MEKNNTKIKKFLAIIKQIENVRSKNNKNWMDLYRLSLAVAPEQSIKIIKKIIARDKSVTKLAEKLIK
tara:strand:- start:285 stop:488 length:204 start_codon:yes stop_codon:yes gene_type:complete